MSIVSAIVLFAVVVSALSGVIVGLFLVRYRAIFFAMLNLAVSMVAYSLLSKAYGITGGTDGLRVPLPTILGMTPDKAGFDVFLYYLAVVLMVVGRARMASKLPFGPYLAAGTLLAVLLGQQLRDPVLGALGLR